MSRKSIGTQGEREIVKRFWENGWASIRSPGSGSSRLPSPDIIAGNKLRKIVVEAKVTRDSKKYFDMEEIEQIKKFGEIFGAEAWVAVKFKGEDWLFVTLEDLASSGNSYVLTKEAAKRKGLLIEEVING